MTERFTQNIAFGFRIISLAMAFFAIALLGYALFEAIRIQNWRACTYLTVFFVFTCGLVAAALVRGRIQRFANAVLAPLVGIGGIISIRYYVTGHGRIKLIDEDWLFIVNFLLIGMTVYRCSKMRQPKPTVCRDTNRDKK